MLANTDLEAVRHLDNQEGDGSLAGRLQDRAQDADGALVVPVVEDEPEHVRVAVPALRDGACVSAAVVLGSWRLCRHPTQSNPTLTLASLNTTEYVAEVRTPRLHANVLPWQHLLCKTLLGETRASSES